MVGTLKKHAPGQMCCCGVTPKCPQTDPLQAQEPWLGYFDPLTDHWNWDRFLPQLYILPPHTDPEYTTTQTTFTTTNGLINPINHPICVVRPMDLFNEAGTFLQYEVEILYQQDCEYRTVHPTGFMEIENEPRLRYYDHTGIRFTSALLPWTGGTWHKIAYYGGWLTSANDWNWKVWIDDVLVHDETPGYGWPVNNECGYQFYMTAGQYSGTLRTLGLRNFVVTGNFNAYA